jgi:hypothetical protein
MATFHERKADRADYFSRFVNGWKQRPCGCCAGSGHYDNDGAPACGACEGSGKERFPPESLPPPNHRPLVRFETSAQDLPLVAHYAQPGMHIPKYRADLDRIRPLVAAERERIAVEKAEAWHARRAPRMRP